MNDMSAAFGHYALEKHQQKLLHWAQEMPVSWVGRRAALILRKAVLLRKVPVVDAIVDGLKMRLYTTDNVSERKFLFMPQFFDRFERDLLKQHLKPGDVFVDIGANAGIYTLTAAALTGDTGRVLSIEPNPVVMNRLLFNLTLNGFDKRVTAIPFGVSDRAGFFDLVLDESNLGGASIVTARSDKKISVGCYPLLDLLKTYGVAAVQALKIDIEGAEDKALMPFFEKAPPSLYPAVIILENSPKDWKLDLTGMLEKSGYTLLQKTRMNMVWERK